MARPAYLPPYLLRISAAFLRAIALTALLVAVAGFVVWSASRPGVPAQKAATSAPEVTSGAQATAWQRSGLALMRQGRTDEAVTALLKAVALDPDLPQTRGALGELYVRAGLFAAARGHFEAATALAPENAAYWEALGSCRIREFIYPGAAEAFERAVALRPAAVSPLLNLADVQVEMNQKTQAEANYRRALSLEPGNPDAGLRLIRFLIEGRTSTPAALSEASALLRPLEAILPGNPYIPFYRGRLALMRRDAPSAITDLKKVVAHSPDVDVAWYALSRAYRLNGNTKEADKAAAQSAHIRQVREESRTIEMVAQQHPDDPAIQLRLARLNAERGIYAKAINAYQYCLSLAPSNAAARDELNRLRTRLQAEGKMPDMTAFNAMVAAVNPAPRR